MHGNFVARRIPPFKKVAAARSQLRFVHAEVWALRPNRDASALPVQSSHPSVQVGSLGVLTRIQLEAHRVTHHLHYCWPASSGPAHCRPNRIYCTTFAFTYRIYFFGKDMGSNYFLNQIRIKSDKKSLAPAPRILAPRKPSRQQGRQKAGSVAQAGRQVERQTVREVTRQACNQAGMQPDRQSTKQIGDSKTVMQAGSKVKPAS